MKKLLVLLVCSTFALSSYADKCIPQDAPLNENGKKEGKEVVCYSNGHGYTETEMERAMQTSNGLYRLRQDLEKMNGPVQKSPIFNKKGEGIGSCWVTTMNKLQCDESVIEAVRSLNKQEKIK